MADDRVNEPKVTEALAEFAATLQFEQIPAEAKTVARHCLMDMVGDQNGSGDDDGSDDEFEIPGADSRGAPQRDQSGAGNRGTGGRGGNRGVGAELKDGGRRGGRGGR